MSIIRRPVFWLIIMMALYALIFGSFVIWKYTTFGYNGLDLAIFNQTLYATVHGQPFGASIHEPSYLGDHASIALLLLVPFYWLWQSPLTLLLLQVLAVALAALPLYGLSHRWLRGHPWWALLLPLVYLLNPFVHYATLFEFEFFLFAVPLLAGALWAWQARRWPIFLVCFTLALLVREDIALTGLAVAGIIWWTDRQTNQPKRWWLVPLVLSLAWGVVGWFITSHFAPTGQYKFLVYYRWLGDDLASILITALSQPWRLLIQLVRWRNIELVLLVLLPWCGLPLRAPRWLWLGIPSFLLYAVSGNGATVVVLQTHYGALISLALAVGGAAALGQWLNHPPRPKRLPPALSLASDVPPLLVGGILIIAPLYLLAVMGIIPQTIISRERRVAVRQALITIPADAAVAASNSLLTPLSSRRQVFASVYAFLGRKQFSILPYQLPPTTEYVVIDGLDIVLDHWRYRSLDYYRDAYPGAAARLRQQLQPFGIIGVFDTILVWQRGAGSPPPYAVTAAQPQTLFSCQPVDVTTRPATHFSCQVQFQTPPMDDYQLAYVATKNDGVVTNRLLPLAYGLYRTSQLAPDQRLTVVYDLAAAATLPDRVCLELERAVGQPTLNYFSSVIPNLVVQQSVASSCWTISTAVLGTDFWRVS